MQRPILKDGVVVNVVEIGEDTKIVSKAKHQEMTASEDAEYLEQRTAWKEVVRLREAELLEAGKVLALASSGLDALKAGAAKDGGGKDAARLLREILNLEGAVRAHEAAYRELRAKPLPPRPQIVRTKRWIHPDGHEIGPVGGNIGDSWDGKRYVKPAKPKPVEAAEPVA